MSLINRMLQDLDRRQALDAAGEAKPVRLSAAKPTTSEWFWRALVVLLTVALAWMGWLAIQLLPRKPLATDLAYIAASEARARSAVKPAPEPIAQSAVPAPAPAPAPATAPIAPTTDALRLETELKTPPLERAAAVPESPQATLTAPGAAAPKKPKAPPVTKRPKEERASVNIADVHYRRAMLLLKDARVGEAEDQLQAALQVDPRHSAARQTYVSLLLEQQRISTARGLLQDTLGADPAQAWFALALARIHAMGRDYAAALAVLDRAASVGQSAEYQAYRGTMLQRLGRQEEAIAAFQSAVRDGAAPATAWIGYAISLEGVGKRAEAAQAYRRALTVGPIAAEAREYAESRARALE